MSEFKITLTSGEGLVGWKFPVSFNTFSEASCLLAERAIELRRRGDTVGYMKTDFKIEHNGETVYSGRYDLRPYGEAEEGTHGPNLFEHVRGFLRFTTGEERPAHMSEESYAEYLSHGKNDKDEVDQFLAEIGQYQ